MRLLLLALSLQIAIPLVDGLAATTVDRTESFNTDLNNSLCHDTSAKEHGAPVGDESHQPRHCLFCLPLAGDHAALTGEVTLPTPKVEVVASIAGGNQREPLASYYVLAHSRAPPRTSSLA